VSRRTQRIANLIRGIVAEAIGQRLSDPRIEALTSVTRVEVSADMSAARVFVSVLASEPRRKLCVLALQHAAGRIRSMVAEQTAWRQVPQLHFSLDESLRQSFETVQALDVIMNELREASADEPAASPETDSREDQ
jgi:ribosome-binding factor A